MSLIILHVIDLSANENTIKSNLLLYPDDTVIKTKGECVQLTKVHQAVMNETKKWLSQNKLTLNGDKILKNQIWKKQQPGKHQRVYFI